MLGNTGFIHGTRAAVCLTDLGGSTRCKVPQGITKNNTTAELRDGGIVITLHETEIFKTVGRMERADFAVLNSGGYATVTTKRRINACLSRFDFPCYLRQDKNKWFVIYQDGREAELFFDGIIVMKHGGKQ